MDGGGLFCSAAFDGVLGMESEEACLIVLLFTGILLADINGELAVVLDNILSKLSLEVEDLVDSILLVVEVPKEEELEDAAGFGNALLAPLKTGTFDA